MFYLVWDKYLETTAIMLKDFETGYCTVDVVKVTSSFYAMKQETELISKTYNMNNSQQMKQVEDRYKLIKEY